MNWRKQLTSQFMNKSRQQDEQPFIQISFVNNHKVGKSV